MSYQDLHDEDEVLFRPIYETSRSFYVIVIILTAVFLFGLGCYIHQLFYGLGATGMDEPVSWAFYIVDFVFFIGSRMPER